MSISFLFTRPVLHCSSCTEAALPRSSRTLTGPWPLSRSPLRTPRTQARSLRHCSAHHTRYRCLRVGTFSLRIVTWAFGDAGLCSLKIGCRKPSLCPCQSSSACILPGAGDFVCLPRWASDLTFWQLCSRRWGIWCTLWLWGQVLWLVFYLCSSRLDTGHTSLGSCSWRSHFRWRATTFSCRRRHKFWKWSTQGWEWGG